MRFWIGVTGLALFGCSTAGVDGGATESDGVGSTSGSATEGTTEGGVAPLCVDETPLVGGDATWAKAPFAPPGDMGEPSDDDGDPTGASGFISDPDGNSVSIECSVWDQDCPIGEKCMPWSNDGTDDWNATRCSPVAPMPGGLYDPCTVEGSPWSGIDDCRIQSMCWDVHEGEGYCIPFCEGSENAPICPPSTWCWIGNEGTTILCLPDDICADDDVCQCMCPEAAPDPDCAEGQCDGMNASTQPPPIAAPPRVVEGEPSLCPDTQEPVVLYMSNDDSNSQASPILARATIREGGIVTPDRVRIHEFLNYYELSHDNPVDEAASVAIQMRRTDATLGEFTLVVSASGRQLAPEDRPPLNLVFSLDTSGSMSGHPIEMLKETIVAVAGSLRAGDVVSAVTWDTAQQVLLDGYEVAGPDDPEVLALAASVEAGGGTDLHAGLVSAYQLAHAHAIDDGINRVVLVSDGGANAGVTDIDLIASESLDADGEGIYLVGVGVGESAGYRDDLMDVVTDAGKGAYVFVDEAAEAEHVFGTDFLANMMVVARNVRLQLTLPWHFGIKSFHGEEYSGNPAEVEPQHLAPNDAMTFHQIVSSCDPQHITVCDTVTARVEWTDPITGEAGSDERTVPFQDVLVEDEAMLRKSDVVVGYAKALIVIGWLWQQDEHEDAAAVAQAMQTWVATAASELGDGELQEIADLLGEYHATLTS